MKTLNENLYEWLVPKERFRLLMAAGARHDNHEVERVIRTTPKKPYICKDAAFRRLVGGSQDVVLAFLNFWAVGYPHLLRQFLQRKEDSNQGKRVGNPEQFPVGEAIMDICCLLTALDDFCAQVGVAPNDLLRFWADQVADQVERIKADAMEDTRCVFASRGKDALVAIRREKMYRFCYTVFRRSWPDPLPALPEPEEGVEAETTKAVEADPTGVNE